MIATPAMIGVRKRSKNVGGAATARRGRLLDFCWPRGRVVDVVGVAVGVGDVSVLDALNALVGLEVEGVLGLAASPSAGGGVASGEEVGVGVVVGRGVTGRRERLATDWNSPVGAMARYARWRRAKGYGSGRFRAGLNVW